MFSIYACLFKFIIKPFVLCFVDTGIKSMDISIKNIFCCFVLLVSRAFIEFFIVGIKSFYWNFYWYQEQLFKNMFILSLYFQLVFKNMFILKFGIKSMFTFIAFIAYLIVYCYAWVKGELLWSLILIHSYITPWVLSSSKGGDCWPRGPSL